MAASFEFVVAIPGLTYTTPIEALDTLFIAHDDPRYRDIVLRDAPVKTFLRRFASPLGKRTRPVIVARRTGSVIITAADLVGFRNAIAVQSVIRARIEFWRHESNAGLIFVDPFDIYPAQPSRENYLTYLTPLGGGLHRISALRGQPGMGVFHPEWCGAETDDALLGALLAVWGDRRRDIEARGLRGRVLRSLEMAYLALRAPMLQMGSKVDRGISFAAWVAAFETLAHQGVQNVGFSDVSSLIKRVPWHSASLRIARYASASKPRKPAAGKRTTTTKPVQIWSRISVERNHALHGTPFVIKEHAHRRTAMRNLLLFEAPCLYRSLLLYLLSCGGFGSFPTRETRHHGDDSRAASAVEGMRARWRQLAYEAPLVGSRAKGQHARWL